MPSNKDSILISFASGILKHFSDIDISGKYILKPNSINIILRAYNKKISTTIPYNVISNAITNIEALQVLRYEIIEELTIGLRHASKNVNNRPMNKTEKSRRRRKRSRK